MLFISTLVVLFLVSYSDQTGNGTSNIAKPSGPPHDKNTDGEKDGLSGRSIRYGGNALQQQSNIRPVIRQGEQQHNTGHPNLVLGGNALQQQSNTHPTVNQGGQQHNSGHPNLALDIMNLSPPPSFSGNNINPIQRPMPIHQNTGLPNAEQQRNQHLALGNMNRLPTSQNNNMVNPNGLHSITGGQNVDKHQTHPGSAVPNVDQSSSYRSNVNSNHLHFSPPSSYGPSPSSVFPPPTRPDWLRGNVYNTDSRTNFAPPSYSGKPSPSSYSPSDYSSSISSPLSRTGNVQVQEQNINVCDVGGRILSVGDTWSTRGICGLFTCSPNKFHTLETRCTTLEYQEGSNCVITEQDLNLDYPHCCPKLDCPFDDDSKKQKRKY